MSAFNWIAIVGKCPACKRTGPIRCQTHVASDYGGDNTDRFHDREYGLRERMAWWPREDKRFGDWRVSGRIKVNAESEWDEEACHSTCSNCNASLYAIIRFHENMAEEVRAIGKEEGWPQDYLK